MRALETKAFIRQRICQIKEAKELKINFTYGTMALLVNI